jgi:hypothetical protein
MTTSKLASISFIAYMVIFTFSTRASLNSNDPISSNQATQLDTDHWFNASHPGLVRTFGAFSDDGQAISDYETSAIQLDKTFDFMVIEDYGNGIAKIDLGQGYDEENNVLPGPNIYLVALEDLKSLEPRPLDFEAMINMSNEEINHVEVVVASRHGKIRKERHADPMTYCMRAVSNAAHMPHVPHASMGFSEFMAEGWHRVSSNWQSASTGTACFFSGGRVGKYKGRTVHLGHAAFKLPNGMWKADEVRAYPYPNKEWQASYHLMGCLHR